jgi:hypothetical protein
LITLAAGDALDCLTLPGVPVIIPDMVYLEVMQDAARLGATGRNVSALRAPAADADARILLRARLAPDTE